MDPRVKKILIEALRSGEYSQDQLYLRTENGYCCLGVACDKYRKELNKEDWETNDTVYRSALDRRITTYKILGEHSILPEEVARWMDLIYDSELSFVGSYVTKDGEDYSLAQLNDNGASFEEIADVIEEYF